MTPPVTTNSAVRAASTSGLPPEDDVLFLCSMQIGQGHFGVDTRTIKEVLPRGTLCKVPLSASYIAGIVPYRGEVLTAVDVRALLGLPAYSESSCIIVFAEDPNEEQFGIAVDSVGTVVRVDSGMYTPNPSTLDTRSAMLYDGLFHTSPELLILLKLSRFQPSTLQRSIFTPRPA